MISAKNVPVGTLAWFINNFLCLKAWLGKGPKGAKNISGFKQIENLKLKTNWKMPTPESRPTEVLSTLLPAGSTKQSTLLKFCPAVSQWKLSIYDVETNCADPQADKTKQVYWWNKYAFNSTGNITVSSVSAHGNNLTWLSALSAAPAYSIIYLCSKYCGRIRAEWHVRCCTNIS